MGMPMRPATTAAAEHTFLVELLSVTESNPYGLAALWAGSDLVAKLVLLMMVVMSAAMPCSGAGTRST